MRRVDEVNAVDSVPPHLYPSSSKYNLPSEQRQHVIWSRRSSLNTGMKTNRENERGKKKKNKAREKQHACSAVVKKLEKMEKKWYNASMQLVLHIGWCWIRVKRHAELQTQRQQPGATCY